MTPKNLEEDAPPRRAGASESRTATSGARAVLLRLRALEALGYREFRLLWSGHVFVSMAFWMDQVTRGWLIYEITNSTVQLGMVRGVQAIPIFLLSPIAGSIADRYSRKLQIISTQVANGVLYAILAFLVIVGQVQPWHVYVTAVLVAISDTFHQPARAAIIADAVPRDRLANAIGLNSMIFNVARSTGPALAGVLIASVGTGCAFGVQAGFYFLATFWTTRLRAGRTEAGTTTAQRESLRRNIVEGWKFSWRNETVRTGLLVVMLASLFIVPFVTLLPVFARDILKVGATGQGLLLTTMGIGALGSALAIASFGDRMPRGLFMLGGLAVYGLSVAGFALSPWFGVSLALMVIVGFTNVCSHALVQTVIQTYSPSEFRDRVVSLFQQSQVVMTVGSMIIGSLAAFCGATWATALMAGAGILSVLAIHWTLPRAWKIT
ncbi:MAG: MFS transporter [Deltaproteobacteria bacterium]|nr:MFS transporter [Deltaproteobacteria bacterium]